MQDTLASVSRFSDIEAQQRMAANQGGALTAEQSISAHLADLAQAQVCVIPYWTNIDEVRRKATKRANDMRALQGSFDASDARKTVMEVGFTSGMLSLFLNSPAEHREALRRIRNFARTLYDSNAQGGLYFLDEAQAAIWTRSQDAQGAGDIELQWLNPNTLSGAQTAHPPAFSAYTPRSIRLPRPAAAFGAPAAPMRSGIPRKGFFRGYEE